jgi:hypothetical protein
MRANLSVFDPTAPYQTQGLQKRRALADLKGTVVGFVDNGKPNFDFLVDDLAELLVRNYGVKSIVKHKKRRASCPASDETIQDLTEQCDLIITGSGD